MKNKTYWNGNKRLASDFLWCLALTILLNVLLKQPILLTSFQGIRSILASMVFWFFLFFFWSWNFQHVKASIAKWSIHVLCFVEILTSLINMVFNIIHPPIATKYWIFPIVVLPIAWIVLIGWKYKNLMWPVNKDATQPTST
jgi:hypothetical protein